MKYSVHRLPKEYNQKVKDAVKKVKEKTGFVITCNEFIRSAIDLKIKELEEKI